ncbi:lipocalin family protein [Winogradskyella sp. SM1960]|uniref:lipocalin family protein n=1 Tax=Winogradskyella sp. SM1960 TaxID=2865955 RepID=UPI001CD5AB35|nr:lipocalin family protein [Winogradskyella sp. SM1960]
MKSLFKNYKLVLVALLIVPLAACSSDDDSINEPTVTELIIQKWYYYKLEDPNATPPAEVILSDCKQNNSLHIFDDGTIEDKSFNLYNDECQLTNVHNLTYEIDENNQYMTVVDDNDYTQQLEIISVTSNSLVLAGEDAILHFKR